MSISILLGFVVTHDLGQRFVVTQIAAFGHVRIM